MMNLFAGWSESNLLVVERIQPSYCWSVANRISRKLLISGLLGLITVVAFWPVVRCGFVNFDDPEYVTDQPYVLGGLTWRAIIWAFTSQQGSNWHPLTSISHMLDIQLFGARATAHHVVSLVYHIVNTLLLFLLLTRMTSTMWRSGLVAALFAIHPLHVESVAWISERKDVLSTLFWLLAIWAYCAYASNESEVRAEKPERDPKWKNRKLYYSLALLFFALGLMSKAMVVTLPFVLLLLDYWPLRRMTSAEYREEGRVRVRSFARLMREKIPFFLLSAGASLVTYAVQRAQGATRLAGELRVGVRVANAVVSYVRYLGKTFWPAELTVFYPHPLVWPHWTIVSACLSLLAVSAFVVWMNKREYLAVGWFWFLGTLVPVIGLVQVGDQAMADRYMYIPSIGLFLALVWGVADVAQRNVALRMAACAMSIVAIGALSVVTQNLTRTWQSSETLFRHALAVSETNAAAHNFLGNALATQGRLKEAREHFAEALRIRPDFPYAQINYATTLAADGEIEDGINRLSALLRKHPDDEEAHCSLGLILQQKGDIALAIEQYHQALRLKPNDAEVLNNLAWIRAANANVSARKGEEAVQLAERACELTGFQKPVMIGTLAAAYAEAGRFKEAIAAAQKAQTIAQGLGQAETAERNRKLMELYQAGSAYHEPD
jgi:protein O-mannosyl-transferase